MKNLSLFLILELIALGCVLWILQSTERTEIVRSWLHVAAVRLQSFVW